MTKPPVSSLVCFGIFALWFGFIAFGQQKPVAATQADVIKVRVDHSQTSSVWRVDQALDNAAIIGFMVGHFGGTPVDLTNVLARTRAGNTNAVLEWIKEHRL